NCDNPGLAISPSAPLWILHTSGSTGKPKGVLQTHRNILHYARIYTEGYCVNPNDRVALLSSFTSNAANHEIFTALLNGASVLPFDVRTKGPASLKDWLAAEQITLYTSVPTLFRCLADTLDNPRRLP